MKEDVQNQGSQRGEPFEKVKRALWEVHKSLMKK